MRLIRVLQGAVLLAGVAFVGPNLAHAQGCNLQGRLNPGLNANCTIQVDGRARTFDVMVPPQLSKNMPITFDHHGFGSNKNQQERGSGLAALARNNKSIVVFPQGIANSFNGQTCCGQANGQRIDDIKFDKMAFEAVTRSLNVTPIVKAVSGISNGMSFTDRAACQAGDFFDLASGVSFQFVNNLQAVCQNPGQGTIYSEFHGLQDETVPFGGGLLQTAPANTAPRQFAQIRGCNMQPQMSRLNSNTMCQTFSGCQGGGIVQMCAVQGGSHVLYPDIAQPNFAVAFDRLLDMAIQIKGGGAGASSDNDGSAGPSGLAPAAPRRTDPSGDDDDDD